MIFDSQCIVTPTPSPLHLTIHNLLQAMYISLAALLSCRRLLDWGADPDCKTLLGETACHLAAYRGHCDVVRHLLAAGCDWSWRNWRGNDVVDEAMSATDSRSAFTAAVVLSTVASLTPSSRCSAAAAVNPPDQSPPPTTSVLDSERRLIA